MSVIYIACCGTFCIATIQPARPSIQEPSGVCGEAIQPRERMSLLGSIVREWHAPCDIESLEPVPGTQSDVEQR